MAQYTTHKSGAQGRSQTIARNVARQIKAGGTLTTKAGHARKVR